MTASSEATSRPASPLDALIKQRGLRHYGLFLVSGEGTFFENGEERKSGYGVDDQGQAFWFSTDWDPKQRVVALVEWEAIDDEPEWQRLGEYQRARARAGLPPSADTMESAQTVSLRIVRRRPANPHP